MTKLYELTEAYVELLSQIEDCETEAEEEQIIIMLNQISDDIARKADAIARMVRNLTAESDGYEAEIKRMQKRKRTTDNMIQRLKDHIMFSMGIAGANELHTTIGKWRLQKNPPKAVVLDESKIPEEYFVEQPPKLMTSLILQNWRDTGEIPDGCDIVQTEGVRFR
jgi:hypothetical protein